MMPKRFIHRRPSIILEGLFYDWYKGDEEEREERLLRMAGRLREESVANNVSEFSLAVQLAAIYLHDDDLHEFVSNYYTGKPDGLDGCGVVVDSRKNNAPACLEELFKDYK